MSHDHGENHLTHLQCIHCIAGGGKRGEEGRGAEKEGRRERGKGKRGEEKEGRREERGGERREGREGRRKRGGERGEEGREDGGRKLKLSINSKQSCP